jgi:biofilm PGA synthesis N-glycosyltransferase PgaC
MSDIHGLIGFWGLDNLMTRPIKPLLQCGAIICLFYFVTFIVMYLVTSTEYQANASFDNARFIMLILLSPILFKYLIQITTAPFYSLVEKHRTTNINPFDVAKVSVLIPAWNEEVGILKTLNSVINTNYPELEIIVINDGSTDGTHRLVSNFIQRYEQDSPQTNAPSTVIKYLKLPNGGKAKALNQGLRIASGEIVMTVDADSVMDNKMIVNMAKRFTDDKVAAVAGNVVVGNRKKPIELLQQLEYLHGFWFKRADSNFNSVHIIGGAAAAYRRAILEEVDGFDETIITEDVELSTRLLALGYTTRYAADAVVYTEGPSEWKCLCSQRLRWKFGRLLTYIKHRSLFFSLSKKHHPYLSCLVLPVAIYAELALFLEAILLTVFYGYTIYTNDYLPLALMICFISSIITLQVLFDPKMKFHGNLLLLAPVAWLMLYVIDLVEFQALCRSLHRLIKRENLEWQTWARVGIISRSVARQVDHS